MVFRILSIFCLMGLLLSGCESRYPLVSSIGETSTIVPPSGLATATVMFTPTIATKLPISAFPTSTETSIAPSPTLEPRMKVKCLDIVADPPEPWLAEGSIVVEDTKKRQESFLLNLGTGSKTILPEKGNEDLVSFSVSPDRKWLAYRLWVHEGTPGVSQLVITASDGQPLEVSPWSDSWMWIAGWLDNQRLWIDQDLDGVEHSLLLVNVANGQSQEFTMDKFPDIYPSGYPGIWGWYGWSRVPTIYDPTLERVLYAKSTAKGQWIVLRDTVRQQDITELPVVVFDTLPVWSPDGKQIVIDLSMNLSVTESGDRPKDEELFILSRDGKLTRLTYLTNQSDQVLTNLFSWSSDSRFIAFVVSVDPISTPEEYSTIGLGLGNNLAILEAATGEVINYCLPSGFSVTPPIWSLDGKSLVVENVDSSGQSRIFLVEPERGTAFQIVEGVELRGWMIGE